ncbi:MAG TPA: ATP-binding protein [Leptolyngbyaceae cyanobacterium M65_K2018_010]|nr:ATP-binding protein [Leptolyngbyaceae cyanobacterium M65_K2018_010]
MAHNQAALAELRRAISLRPNRFSLVLARCNYLRLQTILVDYLQNTEAVLVVPLPTQVRNLRHTLELAVTPATQQAVLVTGLAAVQELEALFKATNLGRDEFPKHFPHPLVLWVNDHILHLLNRYAPDFKSFASAPIHFEYPPGELIDSLHQNANQLFYTMLSLGDDSPYPDQTPTYQPGSPLRTELEFALADLAQAHQALDYELQASLNFLQGRDALSRSDLDLARFYFDQSLTYWQEQAERDRSQGGLTAQPLALTEPSTPGPPGHPPASLADPYARMVSPPAPSNRQKQAVLYFYLGVTWRSWAAVQRMVYRQLLTKAQDCFAACLDIFRTDQQPELVGKFLHPLAEVKQKLEDWSGLEALAQEGLTLHRRDPARLARDHGYLAEVALARGNLQRAQDEAERALDILKIADAVEGHRPVVDHDGLMVATHYQRGWYFYLLAQVQIALGQGATAIDLLAEARRQTQPQKDLTLYRRILEILRQQYYSQKDYRAAFQVKLEQRQIDTQFKLRAFIGAGPIQPHAAATATIAGEADPVVLTTEIEASGRQQDVEALRARLEQPRYPLITIHGPSGVGKSSILYGGLIPALGKSFPEGRATLPVLVKGYRDWSYTIHQALTAALQQRLDWEPEPLPPADLNGLALLHRLKTATQRSYLQIVLIFDQFEEFFADFPELNQRYDFYAFLVDCLKTPYLKVVLALREDYLHYLLELERGFDLDILNNDILSRDHRYYLGNFQPEDAKALIRRLTQEAHFYLEEALLDQLVADLAIAHQVRPIELQVVGAQLQRDDIDTLAAYEKLGPNPKETLVQRFLNVVVYDCGLENSLLAQGILYLLTDVDREKRLYRPQKSREDLEEELTLRGTPYAVDQLELVLEVLVGSGLVFLIPGIPVDRYQLVHDYLMSYVRQRTVLDQLGWAL